MRGENATVITFGAGWGVALSDSLPRAGIKVPELSPELRVKIREFVPSDRASVRNPIDFGAGGAFDPRILLSMIRLLFSEQETDAIVVSGIGEIAPHEPKSVDLEVALAQKAYEDSLKCGKPFVIFTPLTKLSSASVERMIERGIPVCHSISDVVTVLGSLRTRWKYLRREEEQSSHDSVVARVSLEL
jgi:acyl-CoA synthetase (NDP forming)